MVIYNNASAARRGPHTLARRLAADLICFPIVFRSVRRLLAKHFDAGLHVGTNVQMIWYPVHPESPMPHLPARHV
jgi:hypothetical protein